jgi:hypothetical protein
VAATALLLQDDFWHFQAMMARALDRSCWWDSAELPEQQATINDRKTVMAELPTRETNTVADAHGWMYYLIQRRNAIARETHNPQKGPPLVEQTDVKTMELAFCLLDAGRKAVADLAKRPKTDFGKESRVLVQLKHPQRIIDLLNKCPETLKESQAFQHQ